MTKSKTSRDDLIILRNYTLGVVGFATTISSVLIQTMNYPVGPTIICVSAFALMMLLIVWLISRSEARTTLALQEHVKTADKTLDLALQDLAEIKDAVLDSGKAVLRLEMCHEIEKNPTNHDTILKMGEKYFNQLDGDWYMTNRFLEWSKNQKIHLPPTLGGLKAD